MGDEHHEGVCIVTRELDEACARAMDWQVQGGDWLHRSGRMLLHVPAYSTDPATDAEKVAWLTHRGYLQIGVDVNGAAVRLTRDDDRPESMVMATTMTEALARLVVAVAEAEAKR